MGSKPKEEQMEMNDQEIQIENKFKNSVIKNYEKTEDLPKSFFAADKWPECPTLHEIADQSQCGSCWAVSSANVMTDRICIHSNGVDNRKISATDIMSCCTDCGDGCFGGTPWIAFKNWVEKGFVTGGSYDDKDTCKPYYFPPCAHHFFSETQEWCLAMLTKENSHDGFFNTPQCTRSCSENYDRKYWDDLVFGKSWYRLQGEKHMMHELITNGPFVVQIELFDDFFGYKSGVYQYVTGRSDGFHDVRLVGYGEETDGTKYWLIANSWNKGWGDNGYIKVLRGVNTIHIEDDVATGLPDVEYAPA